MKILFIADIVGEPGREILARELPHLRHEYEPDFVIVNGENAAAGKGLTPAIANDFFDLDVNAVTMGNHTFDRREIEGIIENPRILRPLNYPPGVPGHGFNVFEAAGVKVAVISLMGRVYMLSIEDPFRSVNELVEKLRNEVNIIIVDFHAEATSEKQAMGYYLDGRVSAVLGTHTHIPTADEKVLPGGTAYITDAGMTGPSSGVIGMDRETIIKKYLTGLPQYFVVAKGGCVLQGCILDIDTQTGKATSIKRIAIES